MALTFYDLKLYNAGNDVLEIEAKYDVPAPTEDNPSAIATETVTAFGWVSAYTHSTLNTRAKKVAYVTKLLREQYDPESLKTRTEIVL